MALWETMQSRTSDEKPEGLAQVAVAIDDAGMNLAQALRAIADAVSSQQPARDMAVAEATDNIACAIRGVVRCLEKRLNGDQQ